MKNKAFISSSYTIAYALICSVSILKLKKKTTNMNRGLSSFAMFLIFAVRFFTIIYRQMRSLSLIIVKRGTL